MGAPIDCFSNTYSVDRRAPGAWVEGNWVPSEDAPAQFNIAASIQPKEDFVRDAKTETGQRKVAGIAIFTETELRQVDQDANTRGDLVTYQGDTWEVQKVKRWDQWELAHFECFATRVENDHD